jgi:hypothetical protein
MDVVAGQAIVQDRNVEFSELLSHPHPIGVSVAGELQQKSPVVTPMRQVKDSSFDLEPIRSRHGLRLTDWFRS